MRRALPSVLPWGLLLVTSTAVFVAFRLREADGGGWAWNSPAGHFWVVSAASIVCVTLALAAGIATTRTRSPHVLLIALSFLSMAGVFAVHGLATPGFILGGGARAVVSSYGEVSAAGPPSPFYNITGFSSRFAFAVSAAFLAAGAAPWPRLIEGWIVRARVGILLTATAALAAYGVVAIRAPWVVPTLLTRDPLFAWGTTIVVVALGVFATVRYANAYRHSGLQMHGAVAIGSLLLVEAQLSLHFGATWSGTFWLYHLQLLGGFMAIFWGMLVEFSRGHAVHSLETLTVGDVLDQLRSGYTEPIVALSAALEARDGYTLGHGERVAALAVLIGQRMKISGGRLRGIAAGALLHDVGKIGVPDAILHKRANLTAEETAVIREHPARGADMLRHHFDQRVEEDVIRHHHERWDGTGYPDALAGESIPLEARIAAVADVYDALRSNRAYRGAYTQEEAVDMVLTAAGAHFDPRCVDAFLAVVDRWETRYAPDAADYAERRVA